VGRFMGRFRRNRISRFEPLNLRNFPQIQRGHRYHFIGGRPESVGRFMGRAGVRANLPQ
jgi:hypothetical protein